MPLFAFSCSGVLGVIWRQALHDWNQSGTTRDLMRLAAAMRAARRDLDARIAAKYAATRVRHLV